jgi:phage terminase large subunit-like protein
MGSLHGPQDRRKKANGSRKEPLKRREPWKKRGLSRADRVITFLQTLPITKGVLVGKKMKLLPGQRRFVQAIYGRLDIDGRRQIRIAIKSEPRGNGKTGLLASLALCHLLGPESEPRGEIYSASWRPPDLALADIQCCN